MRLVGGVVVAVVAACAAPPVQTPPAAEQPAGWDADIAIKEAEDLDPADDVVRVELEARLEVLEVEPGVLTEMWTYNGQVPGPTIRAKRGDRVVVELRNALPDPTTIHWHGLRVPAAMDGTDMMQAPVEPGGSFTYDFVVEDAGTYWYHPHIDSSAQVGYGLYGAFVVSDDEEDPALGDDLVLVLSDVGLDADGVLLPGDHQGWFGDFFGRQGNTSLVNGRVSPTLRARAGVPQRWRIVNASRAKYERIAMPGSDFTLVGSDGGLIEKPVKDAVVTLPPGARAEVVFSPRTQGDTLPVVNVGVNHFHIAVEPEPETLFNVAVTDDAPVTPPALPPKLRDIEVIDVEGAPEQEVILNTAVAEDGNTYFAINGALGHDGEPFMARVGTNEVWTLRNTTNQDHPFHLHGFFFQVLDGGAPQVAGGERAWLDTINLEPNQTVRIAIPFDDRAGNWMFHCHILDHGDTGMMRMLMLMPL